MTREVRPPTPAQFAAARAAVAANLRPTPIVALQTALGTLWCKLESLQPGGSFKVRGAVAAVSAAVAERPDVQVVTCSAGNHGLGVAYAAQLLSVPATVVLARTASAVKVARLKGYDIELVQHGESFAEAQIYALELAEERNARYISPYNDADVIAGQSTVATELLDQLPDVAHLLVPVGGGGLLVGDRASCCATSPRTSGCSGCSPRATPRWWPRSARATPSPSSAARRSPTASPGAIEEGSVTIDLIKRARAPRRDARRAADPRRGPHRGGRPRARPRGIRRHRARRRRARDGPLRRGARRDDRDRGGTSPRRCSPS